jgi:hypothetical protein
MCVGRTASQSRSRMWGGAPPRAWGGQTERRAGDHGRRSTPTCVGRTYGHRRIFPEHPEHPHVRGEDGLSAFKQRGWDGAPPRAWGGHPQRLDLTNQVRSTPTCVGRTQSAAAPPSPESEHPHVRGEDSRRRGAPECLEGAPPRAWGGRFDFPLRGGDPRSTPTCVGRTQQRLGCALGLPEHPHVRGEDAGTRFFGSVSTGAPPRAWGGHLGRGGAGWHARSTPTCVGRTAQWVRPARCWAEHPHVRGEDTFGVQEGCVYAGAPPRAWGGQHDRGQAGGDERSTPTCVGRTTVMPPVSSWISEHPHVRGEDSIRVVKSSATSGAPPRAWGGHLLTWDVTRPDDRFGGSAGSTGRGATAVDARPQVGVCLCNEAFLSWDVQPDWMTDLGQSAKVSYACGLLRCQVNRHLSCALEVQWLTDRLMWI